MTRTMIISVPKATPAPGEDTSTTIPATAQMMMMTMTTTMTMMTIPGAIVAIITTMTHHGMASLEAPSVEAVAEAPGKDEITTFYML